MTKIWQILRDINELIVFKHSVFALPFIFVAMISASKIDNDSMWFGWKLLILGAICAVSARNFAMAYNRLKDEDIDRPNPRCASRPSVDGRIGRVNLILFIGLNAVIFVVCAYFINLLAFCLSLPFLLILAGYSHFKRFSEFAHLALGICQGLAPIAGVVAVSGEIPMWAVLLAFGSAFWVGGFDILYSLQDIEYDKKAGLFSIPARYGWESALFISKLFHILSVIFWFLFVWGAGLGIVAYFGVVVNAVILYFEHKIVVKDFSKIDRAFFTLNGYLGILFFIFVWVSLW